MAWRESLEGALSREADIQRLYEILDGLLARVGARTLLECHGRMNWPQRGVYFFFETGEKRTTSGTGPRVVRVGTHAITGTSSTSLWDRLSAHRGTARSGSGNHRGSVFRLLVGEALITRGGLHVPSWAEGGSLGEASQRLGMTREAIRDLERPVELAVSVAVGAMPFVWICVDDLPSTTSQRAFVERNAIALLSNYGRSAVDPPSDAWLGRASEKERVRLSGLWNNNHVEETYDPAFLDVLAGAAESTRSSLGKGGASGS